MGFARCEIQVVPDHTFPQSINMVMSRSLAEKLHLAHFPVWVKFGSKVAKGWIAVHSAKSSLIRISSKLARSLRLPDHLSLCASSIPSRTACASAPSSGSSSTPKRRRINRFSAP